MIDIPGLFSITAQERLRDCKPFGRFDKKPCFSSANPSGMRASKSSFFLSDILLLFFFSGDGCVAKRLIR
jgi:hypothetical protein